jgi:predicted ATPase/DNA-binding winged helix-turn-helix (wHTH) protein
MTNSMRFQHFEIKPDERRLLIANREAVLGARAFDLLLALASRHGQVISKHALMDIVWPDVVVEENNLQVQISTLRKLLGSSTITTMPGRGYCLSAELVSDSTEAVTPLFEQAVMPPLPAQKHAAGNLPASISKLYGRDADVAALTELLNQHRLITVTGTGGMGKTHLAKSVAGAKRHEWTDGVWWLDATTAHDLESLIDALAQCFRIGLKAQKHDAALQELAQSLQSQQLLLVIDNCEHVLESAKQVAMTLLQLAPDIQILATSQAKLHAPGEYVYQLGTLAMPNAAAPAEQAMQYGAIQLFVERVQQLDRHFKLDEIALPGVVSICQQLDGVALAIELAAARVPMLGVQGVRERLGERLRLLGRTSKVSDAAADRQATMRTTLEWSHRLLTPVQAQMFRRLGVFVGSFSLEAAKHLLCDDTHDEWDMMALLESLIHQSLVVVTDDQTVRYRMMETHRHYALEKLNEAGELNLWQQRFAQAMVSLCRHFVKTRSTRALWDEMNHNRSAYDWAVVQPEKANHEIAIALATASAMLLLVSGFAHEACTRLLKVEAWVDQDTPKSIAARYWQWLGRSGVHGRLPTSRCIDAFVKSEKIFQSLDDWRHVHACRRMRAEALLDSHQLAQAKAALLEAQAMESPDWPIADRMRRMKVQAILAAKLEQNKTALRLAGEALSLAELGGIERYVLAIQLDIANIHLTMGSQDEALELFRLMTSQTRRDHFHRVTIAEAYAGFVTVLMNQNELAQAAQICLQALPHWRSSGIFLKHGDLLAWWLVRIENPLQAARMLGAANTFFAAREIKREAIGQKNYDHAMRLLSEQATPEQMAVWMKVSSGLIDEKSLADSMESNIHQYLRVVNC